MKRIILGVQYDGGSWQGWQRQPHGNTVQNSLESAVAKFAQHPVDIVCAGRTDAGVHAIEQVLHFDSYAERELFSWVRGVNTLLPSSIGVRWAAIHEANDPEPFHARFSATARTYHYLIHNDPIRSPLLKGRAGWVFRPLQAERMHEAAQLLVGTHDFSAYRAAECQANTPVRTMHQIDVAQQGQLIMLTFKANAFLHHMVRNIVGSLVQVGIGNQPASWIADLLQGRDRSVAAPTFAPDGLYLAKVDYDPRWALPQGTEPIPIFWNAA